MNTELLLKVKSAILAEPLKFDMTDWFTPDSESPCGTAACIAGHAVAISIGAASLNEGQRYWVDELVSIAEILGCHWEQKDRLCYVPQWPLNFQSRYQFADSRQERANIAADRIDFFIATNGTDRRNARKPGADE